VLAANYVPYRFGGLLYLSRQGPEWADGTHLPGRLGREATIEGTYQDARLTGLNLLAVAKSVLGELS
jgi:hypothetical protein